MAENAEGWLDTCSDGHIRPLSNLTALQVSFIKHNLVDIGKYEAWCIKPRHLGHIYGQYIYPCKYIYIHIYIYVHVLVAIEQVHNWTFCFEPVVTIWECKIVSLYTAVTS